MLKPDLILASAQDFVARGMSVIPLHANKKTPSIKWEEFQSKAANDNQLIEWFANEPHNLGVITGSVSGLLVLDVDDMEGLKGLPPLPKTPTVLTGKGLHVYLKHPGYLVKNKALLGLGDIRADGGYVVAPPSVHPDGKQYTWEIDLDVPLADPMRWLLERVDPLASVREAAQAATSSSETTAYGKSWYRDVEELANLREGGRNTLLNEVACKAGSHIARGNLDEREARSAMYNACVENELIQNDGRKSFEATMSSGLKEGLKHPRGPDPQDVIVTKRKQSTGQLVMRKASDIVAKPTDWQWNGVLARGHLTLLAGEGGTGKSQLAISLAAIISTGGKFPVTNEEAVAGNVIILSSEDRAEDTIKPRLQAAGADCSNVFIIEAIKDDDGERGFNLTTDMPLLHQACDELGNVRFIVVDPVSGYMNGKDLNKASDVRPITTALAALADKYMASVVMITHQNKSTNVTSAAKVLGAGSWVHAARISFSVSKGDGDLRLMSPIKANITPDDQTYAYKVQGAETPEGIETSKVVWEQYVQTMTADDVLEDRAEGGLKVQDAMAFLKHELRNGPVAYKDLKAKAEQQDITKNTLYRARQRLSAVSCYAEGVSCWKLAA